MPIDQAKENCVKVCLSSPCSSKYDFTLSLKQHLNCDYFDSRKFFVHENFDQNLWVEGLSKV